MPHQLTISPAPFKSSRLAIPPSPFSPRFPVTPPATPPNNANLTVRHKAVRASSPPPPAPMHWLWQCHMCNRVYKLGVTRRCLDDGHFFCAGTTVVKRSRKTGKQLVRHKACASEFDYQGWKAWGTWRREVIAESETIISPLFDLPDILPEDEDLPSDASLAVIALSEGEWLKGVWTKKVPAPKARKDCWNTCDYPSECRWGKKYGVPTPTKPTVTVPSSSTVPSMAKTSFEDILGGLDSSITDPDSPDYLEPLTAVSTNASADPDVNSQNPIDEVVASAKSRKRKSGSHIPSPLASNPLEATQSSDTPASTEPSQAISQFSKRSMSSTWNGESPLPALVGSSLVLSAACAVRQQARRIRRARLSRV